MPDTAGAGTKRLLEARRGRRVDCSDDSLDLCRHEQAGRGPRHLKVFASLEAALAWFELNDPEGVAFEYEVRSSLVTNREAHDRFQQEVDIFSMI